MHDYKIVQKIYNRLQTHEDWITDKNFTVDENPDAVVDWASRYFVEELDGLVYPAKSYAVAIIYAYLLELNFDAPPLESLDDPDLLCGNDRYFQPYSRSADIYDRILAKIGFFDLNFRLAVEKEQLKKTVDHFAEEFSIPRASLIVSRSGEKSNDSSI